MSAKNKYEITFELPAADIEQLKGLALMDGEGIGTDGVIDLTTAVERYIMARRIDPDFAAQLAAARKRQEEPDLVQTPQQRAVGSTVRLVSSGKEQELATDYSLPKVSPATVIGMRGDINELGLDEYIKQSAERLKANNPVLYDMVDDGDNDEGVPDGERVGVLLAHELLRRQTEADTLNLQFKEPVTSEG